MAARDVVDLQRTLGNHATGALIAHGKRTPSGDTGQALPAPLRDRFEQSLGVDLGAVRLHTGPESAVASSAFDARAFTVGQDIHFAAGQFDPRSTAGQHLLAHEVAHTRQQGGSPATAQAKLDVSQPGDAHEHEADRAADAMVRGRPASVGTAGTATIARSPTTPFKGAAGKADLAAIEASGEAMGVAPLDVGTDYIGAQMVRKDEQLEEFRKADIPFVKDNQEHPLYARLIRLRQEYEQDIPRISVAQGAFNEFALPGTLASKSTAQFKALQFELGYFDETDPTEDLSAKEESALAKKLDVGALGKLNDEIGSRSGIVTGLQKQILGATHKLQASLQQRAALLAVEAKEKAQADKTAIEEKISAVKNRVETVGSIIEAVSFGVGVPGKIADIKAGGTERAEAGLELGGMAVSMIGEVAEFIMTQKYKDELQKAQEAIKKAVQAEAAAKAMDAQLNYEGSLLDLSGLIEELKGQMGLLALSLQARKEFFGKLGQVGDKATRDKPGGKLSQYVAYVAQASETKTHLESARSIAETSYGVMAAKAGEMYSHRHEWYGVAGSVWAADPRNMIDGNGPDLDQINQARFALEKFGKSAGKQMQVVDDVVNSLPKPKE